MSRDALLLKLEALPPSFLLTGTKWDETGERLAANKLLLPNVSDAHTQSSTWQVFVSRRRFLFGWFDPSAAEDEEAVLGFALLPNL